MAEKGSNPGLLILISVPFLAHHVASKDCSSSFTGTCPIHTLLACSFLSTVCFHQGDIHCLLICLGEGEG